MTRRDDIVSESETPGQLLARFGPDAYEVIAFRALTVRMRLAQAGGEVDEDGRLKVGENFFRFAAGEIDGRELCELENLVSEEEAE